MTSGDLRQRLPAGTRPRFVIRPSTRPGRWAVGLPAANVLLVPAWRILGPPGAFRGLVCGLAGGVVAFVAIVRLLPFAFVVTFVLAELLIGHG